MYINQHINMQSVLWLGVKRPEKLSDEVLAWSFVWREAEMVCRCTANLSSQNSSLASLKSRARFTKCLTTILASSDDNAKVTIDLQQTSNYKTSYKDAGLFLGIIHLRYGKIIWDSVCKLAYDKLNIILWYTVRYFVKRAPGLFYLSGTGLPRLSWKRRWCFWHKCMNVCM